MYYMRYMRLTLMIFSSLVLFTGGCWQLLPIEQDEQTSDTPKQQYTLTVKVEGQGSVSPETASYPEGTVVKLTATPEDGWSFKQWKGASIGITETTLVTMNKDKQITAVFIEQEQDEDEQEQQEQDEENQENEDQNQEEEQVDNPKVRLSTSMGDIVIELYPNKAPKTVANFLSYVLDGFYDGKDGKGATIFHRVVPNFVIQGGGLTADLIQKATKDPIINEANNGLKNKRGTVAMARTSDPNSATSQFFINLVDNDFLDYVEGENDGYAVFGEVVEGMDVVDKIASVETHTVGQYENVPVEPITINSATVETK